jgi:bis(5'-nucleosyl)-tetraphosphatase (symmetrical)
MCRAATRPSAACWRLDFSPSRDTLYVLGDLVNRGPDSLAVLRRLMALGDCGPMPAGQPRPAPAGVAHGVRAPHRNDTLDERAAAPDRAALLDWLRHRPLALQSEHGVLMVHAGVLPSWTVAQTLALAAEVEAVLRGRGLAPFLAQMYGNQPTAGTTTCTGRTGCA